MNLSGTEFLEIFKSSIVTKSLVILISLMFGYVAGKLAGRAVARAVMARLDSHQVMVAQRFAFYLVFGLSALTGLNEAGINLSVLVGAAGVASVAIGFASQTTMSNLISGMFMLIERPFMIGDVIRIGSTSGEVSTMGLFSTILKTPDNMMVRIPNETLMKSEIINATRYPLRRVEVLLGVSYAADIGIARTKISEAIKSLSVIRKEPEPAVQFKSFGDNAIQLGVEFWVEKERVTEAYNLAAVAIKTSLEQAAIQMPSPQRELYFSGDQKLKVQVFNA